MALIDCYECGKKISSVAPACPHCGAPSAQNTQQSGRSQKKQMGPFRKLIIGLFWGFVGLSVLGLIVGDPNNQTNTQTSQKKTTYPESSATFDEVDSAVGCASKYSDDKKDDIFNAEYRNTWMTWRGEIVLVEAGEASLNIDGVGTQDLAIDFADENAGYDLKKGEFITVRFLMKSAGGCFLPFSGEQAVINGVREKERIGAIFDAELKKQKETESMEDINPSTYSFESGKSSSKAGAAGSQEWSIQIASLSSREVANKLVNDLRNWGYKAYIRKTEGMNRVFVGPMIERAEANRLRDQLSRQQKLNGFIVRFEPEETGSDLLKKP